MSMVTGQDPGVAGASWELSAYRRKTKAAIQFCTEFPVHTVKRKCIVPLALIRNIFGYRCKE